MEIERGVSVAIDALSPHPQNYNAHPARQIAELRRSLRAFGQVRDIIVWQAYIVAGHGVVTAAREEGWASIMATRLPGDWDEARVLAYMAADNETARLSEPDEAQLAALLQAVDDEELRAIAAGGTSRLREIMAHARQRDDPGARVDIAEELREKWAVESGQLWQVGEHRIICGDCTDPTVVSRVMGGERAWLGVTSPPYAVGKGYEVGVTFAQHLVLLRGMADRALEAIEPGGFFFVNFGDIASQRVTRALTDSKRQCVYPMSKDYWQIFHVERGCDLYAQRIWFKPFNRLQQPFWTYRTSIPHHQEWEHLWLWRCPGSDDDKQNLQSYALEEDPGGEWEYLWTMRLPGGEKDQRFLWAISSRAVWDTRAESTDDRPLSRHEAAFPLCLPERALLAHSAVGAIVYEPFLGSGTTLVACERLGRRGRGVEVSPESVAVSLERLAGMGLTPELVDD